MNFDYYISDIDILSEFISDCIDNGYRGFISEIKQRYKNLIDHIPYSFFFCNGLNYEDISVEIKDTDLELNILQLNLKTLRGRIVTCKSCSTVHVDVKFSEIKKVIIEHIEKASQSINIAVAWITDPDICNMLIQKSTTSIPIKIIMYDDECNKNTPLTTTKNTGIDILFVKKSGSNIMHNKFCIFDNNIVITGSYNWTKNAQNNYENIILILNHDIATSYTSNFNKLIKKNRY